MDSQLYKLQEFYQKEKALVTSPFITQEGHVNVTLLDDVFIQLGVDTHAGILLDVGCGTGLLSQVFQNIESYIGIDIVQHPPHRRLMNDHRQFLQADAQRIPIKSHSVDFMICLDSFEHYPNQTSAAKEFYRVLKHGGQLFLSVPNYSNVAGGIKWLAEKWGRYKKNTWAPFDFWKPEELEHFVTSKKIETIFFSVGFNQLQFIGYDKELDAGLFPWILHPLMPGAFVSLIRRCFSPFAKPVVKRWPTLSLHTFWKIIK